MSEQFDVVVVGGRVAGAATALLLARAGVRVRGRYVLRIQNALGSTKHLASIRMCRRD